MPTYQYSCADCGHFLEQVQSFSEDSLTVCPQCRGRLRKVFNAVGVVFKGSGFYRTDSRADARKGEGGASDGGGGGTGEKKAAAGAGGAGGGSAPSSDAGSSGAKTPASTSAA